MPTFWKAEGVPQWTVLVMSVVPSLWRRTINMSNSSEHLGVGIVATCFPSAFHWGLSGRAGMGVGREVKGRGWLPSCNSQTQHLCMKGLYKAITFKITMFSESPNSPHTSSTPIPAILVVL